MRLNHLPEERLAEIEGEAAFQGNNLAGLPGPELWDMVQEIRFLRQAMGRYTAEEHALMDEWLSEAALERLAYQTKVRLEGLLDDRDRSLFLACHQCATELIRLYKAIRLGAKQK